MSAVVVGGGLAGLVAARELALAGEHVTLLEASDHPGGMVTPVALAGIDVDGGAEAYATRTDVVRSLCDELRVPVAAPQGRAHVFWPDGDRRWPLAEGILGIPAALDDDSLKGALTDDELVEVRRLAAAPREVSESGVTVADLVEAHLGRVVVERLVAPLTTGVYRMPPERMPVEQFAPGLLAAVRETGSLTDAVAALTTGRAAVEQPVGGMFRLVEALSADLVRLGVEVRTGSRVTGLSRDATQDPDQMGATSNQGGGAPPGMGRESRDRRDMGWDVNGRVRVGIDHSPEVVADRVVLAVPARIVAELLMPFGIQFEVPAVTASRSVLLAVRHPDLQAAPIGSGVLLAQPVLTATALTHYSAKWPWAARDDIEVLRVAWPATVDPDLDAVLADVRRITGVDIQPDDVIDHRVVTWSEMPRALSTADRSALLEQVGEHDGLAVTGAWVHGNGLAAVVAGAKETVR